MDAQKWLRCRGIINAPLYNFYLLVLVMLRSHGLWCHSCFPPYWIWMFNSYFQLVLHRHNSWLVEHHRAKANFMCVAYLRNGCGYKYNHAWMGEDLNQLPITDKPKSFNNGTQWYPAKHLYIAILQHFYRLLAISLQVGVKKKMNI